MQHTVTVGSMQPLVGTRLNLVGHDVSLEMVAIEQPDPDRPDEVFALLFEGPTDAALWQGLWTLASADGEFEVFLVPIGPRGPDRLGYEAVFNRLPSSGSMP